MDRSLLIYVIIFISIFSLFCSLPLKGEYIYMRIAESYNVTIKSQTQSCSNQSQTEDAAVATAVSKFNLLINIAILLPSSFVAMIITVWGDKVGRKVTLSFPIVGFIFGGTMLSLIIHFNWPLYAFYICNVGMGFGGFSLTLVTQGNAYISDITPPEKRGKRFVILETSIGVGAGIAGVSSGYWFDSQGYFPPIVVTTALQLVVLFLIFLLPDSLKIREMRNETLHQSSEDRKVSEQIGYGSCEMKTTGRGEAGRYTLGDLLRSVWRVYSCDFSYCEECAGPLEPNRDYEQWAGRCIHKGGGFKGRVWRMWAYLIAENIFIFSLNGGSEIQTIFLLAGPLCFTPLLVGLQQGLKFTLYALSPLLVIVYQRCCALSNNVIALIGIVGLMVYYIFTSLATTPVLIFSGTSAMIFVNTTRAFILAQMSAMVLKTEQGAAYALVGFNEMLAYLLCSVAFLTIYPATVDFFRGFVWDFGAGVLLISVVLIMLVHVSDRKRARSESEDQQPLLT